MNMKKLAMMAVALTATLTMSAQHEPGTFSIQPKLGGVGAMLSNMPDMDFGSVNGADIKLDKDAVGGGLIGAEFEYQLTNTFSLAAGLNYSQQGSAWKDFDEKINGANVKIKDTKVVLGYINLPVVVNAYLFRGFAVKTGVQFGYLTNANVETTVSATQGDFTNKLEFDKSIRSECEKLDISIPVGISYEFKVPIVIDARYNIGLTKVNKDDDEKAKNQVFQITVGYKFEL